MLRIEVINERNLLEFLRRFKVQRFTVQG